ncbi:MAG TPA: alpha/beta hydrolase [Rubrobacter sp.]|nr:alpha/beta hydrolase [Rubrobacter sp.]
MRGIPWKGGRVPGEVEISIGRAGEGPDPVVCLHGITAQHRAFTPAARRVGPDRGLVGVDLRGRGDSDKPDAGYGLEAHAGDVVRVLDHLGLEEATIAGHSMGAFIGLKTALAYPDRVRALVLLDGGWPRTEAPSQEEMTEEQQREVEAIREGLARAFSRLDMVFETPEAYLDFWFPEQNLTMADLPPDLADYYLYDLQEVEGGYNPKCSTDAAKQDSPDVTETSPTADEMRAVRCPVALVRASEGFFPGSRPLIPDATRDLMAEALDLRSEMVLPGANHYTMLWPEYTPKWAGILRDDSWFR